MPLYRLHCGCILLVQHLYKGFRFWDAQTCVNALHEREAHTYTHSVSLIMPSDLLLQGSVAGDLARPLGEGSDLQSEWLILHSVSVWCGLHMHTSTHTSQERGAPGQHVSTTACPYISGWLKKSWSYTTGKYRENNVRECKCNNFILAPQNILINVQ